MQCESVDLYTQEQCKESAIWNSNLCRIHAGVHSYIPSTRPTTNYRSDQAFTPHTDKLTKAEKTFINGLGKKPKPVIKKEKPIMIKEPKQVSEQSLLTISEVASMIRVSMLTLKRWEKRGQISCIRINSRGDRRYLRSEIDKLLGGK